MKLAISVLDGDPKTFRETFENFTDSWRSLRYTLKNGLSLMLKKGHQMNNSNDHSGLKRRKIVQKYIHELLYAIVVFLKWFLYSDFDWFILAHCENDADISQTRDDHFTLTLTFLHVVALARKKQPLLDFLDQEISMEDWLEPVNIRKSNSF